MPESHSNPARNAFVVTPDNSNDLPFPTRGIMVAVSGDLEVIMIDSTAAIVISGVAAGVVHPICAKRIRAANTTATGITAFY